MHVVTSVIPKSIHANGVYTRRIQLPQPSCHHALFGAHGKWADDGMGTGDSNTSWMYRVRRVSGEGANEQS